MKKKETKMVKCPGCELEFPENDLIAHMKHMEAAHPDIIARRLREAKIPCNVNNN
ncbi:MAG: hypothetical protein WC657_08065 [Candidatus Paceibacterota bacterium]|jgi:hypothetical protein